MDMIVIIIFAVLTLLSVPIGFSLFLASMIGFIWFTDISLIMLGQAMFIKLDKFSLLSILFFVLAGNLMARGAIARKIVELANSLVGHFKSGLPISGVVSCGLFGAVSGSALATLAAIGGLIVPEMRKKGFSDNCSVGLMTSASIIGIIVPPSIPMIIYCLVTDVSIARMFMGGFLPALFLILALSVYCIYAARKESASIIIAHTHFSFFNFLKTMRTSFWALLMPAIIFGGIFSGVFTATEAAVVACVYAYLVEFFVYRELTAKEIIRITIDAGVMLSSILIITAGSMVLSDYLTFMEIPGRITEWICSSMNSQLMFWIMVNILLLLIGCLVEVIAAILILAPILLPAAMALGIDPVHFGLIMCINLGIGYVTPPVGVNCFLAAKLFNVSTVQVFKSVVPSLLILLISLGVLVGFPEITTLLPDIVLGGTN
jgi:C4-dicarboxylate transporter DctM subunit